MTVRGPLDNGSRPEVQVHVDAWIQDLWGNVKVLFVDRIARIESRLFLVGPGMESIHVNCSTKTGKRDFPIRSQIEYLPSRSRDGARCLGLSHGQRFTRCKHQDPRLVGLQIQ